MTDGWDDEVMDGWDDEVMDGWELQRNKSSSLKSPASRMHSQQVQVKYSSSHHYFFY